MIYCNSIFNFNLKFTSVLIDYNDFFLKVATTAQSDSQRVFVQQKYPADKLYHVTSTYTATDLMDLSVMEGDCVGLVMDKDPMGNKDRWFIDNGGLYFYIYMNYCVL